MGKRLAAATGSEAAVQRSVNALNSLVGNRYLNKVRIPPKVLCAEDQCPNTWPTVQAQRQDDDAAIQPNILQTVDRRD